LIADEALDAPDMTMDIPLPDYLRAL
jgi:hypothetical protein